MKKNGSPGRKAWNPPPPGRQKLTSPITGSGLGLLVSQLNNFTLAPIAEERVSEAAGVNSAAGSFGLSFGLAVAGGIMLWTLALSFTHLTETSTVIPPAQKQQIYAGLEHDAEIMSNTQLQQQIAGEPPAVEAEVLAINTRARNRSLQIALPVACAGDPRGARGGDGRAVAGRLRRVR